MHIGDDSRIVKLDIIPLLGGAAEKARGEEKETGKVLGHG